MAAGGAGGLPSGVNGGDGDGAGGDSASGTGGAGGSTPFGPGGAGGVPGDSTGKPGLGAGAGGGGAGFTDRTVPLNWAGGDGVSGLVAISWGGLAPIDGPIPQ